MGVVWAAWRRDRLVVGYSVERSHSSYNRKVAAHLRNIMCRPDTRSVNASYAVFAFDVSANIKSNAIQSIDNYTHWHCCCDIHRSHKKSIVSLFKAHHRVTVSRHIHSHAHVTPLVRNPTPSPPHPSPLSRLTHRWMPQMHYSRFYWPLLRLQPSVNAVLIAHSLCITLKNKQWSNFKQHSTNRTYTICYKLLISI